MRKIVSFLALLVIAFALPHGADAKTVYWDNSTLNWDSPYCHYWGGTNSSTWPGVKMEQVVGTIYKCEVGDATGIQFNPGDNSKEIEFTPTDGHLYKENVDVVYSTMTIYWDNSGKNWTTPHIHYWGGYGGTKWPGSAMVHVEDNIWKIEIPSNATNLMFDDGSDNGDKIPTDGGWAPKDNHKYNNSGDAGEYVTTPAGPLDFSTNTNPKSVKLVFDNGNGSYDLSFSNGTWSKVITVTNVATDAASGSSGYVNFNVEVTKSDNTTATLGVNAGAHELDWATVSCGTGDKYYQGRMEAGKKYLVEVTGTGTGDEFKFKFTEQAYTPVGPATLYLYNTAPSRIASATNNNDIFTFKVSLAAQTSLLIATSPNAITWPIPGRWNPQGNKDIPGNDIPMIEFVSDETTPGSWQTTERGVYTITVDWVNKKLTATCEPIPDPTTFMPLTSKDFDKPHYFLVGERMGEWHLQPEWEFTKDGNELVLQNRYLYTGRFAIGVVSTYDDYINHKFQYYGERFYFTNSNLSAGSEYFGNARTYSAEKQYTRGNPTNPDVMKINFEGDDDNGYYQGKGKFIKEIRVTLNANGVPTGIRFVPGTDAEATANRMFALLGDNIYNRSFSNTSGTGQTAMFDKGKYKGNGWQEGWIQYDPVTNRPYVDGRGEYLYHTSFTPDYMLTHPVQFNQELPTGGDFVYNSSYAQFVEYDKLTDLDSDPYKDFYQAFTNKDAINTGVDKGGANYNYDFSVKVENGGLNQPTGTWSCYVVRDMWIAGEIKFWTGWGGNDDTTNGGKDNIAVWHGPNGGPNIGVDGRQNVKGFDINSNQQVTIYRNGRNINNANYVVSADNKPVYFNRVVLWYNEAGEVGESFIQFIQESAGPAILAQPMEQPAVSPEPGKKNYIQYHWYLNKVADGLEEEENRKVLAYEISRYRIVDGKAEPIGYPEGEIVYIKDVYPGKDVTVKDLYEENAGSLPFTTFLDKGIVGDRGFAPGLYQYDIYVTYEGGARKLAVSNQVPIYGDIAPDAVPMQLVELRGAYTDKFDTNHISAAEQLQQIDAAGDYAGYKYMTYRTNSEDKFYIMKDIVDSEDNNIPVDVKLIDRTVAMEFLENHPDKYWWTSDYYVRCLDYNAYARLLQGYIDAKTIEDTTIPEPTLEIFDVIIPEGGSASDAKSVSRGNAHRFDFDGQSYYSAVVKRGGNLSDGTFDVKLTYSYIEKGATEATEHTAQAAAGFDPVTPRPFAPLYRYTYARDKRENPEEGFNGYKWGKVTVPVNNWNFYPSTGEAMKAGSMKDVYVKFDEHFDPRSFTLEVDFYRPNVNADIYKFYDIKYYVNMTNADTEAQEDEATRVPLKVEAVLHDTDLVDSDVTGETPNRYRMEFKGLHPRNGVYPTVEFVKTEYVPNKATDEVTGEVFKSQTGNFGKMLKINAVRSLQVNKNVEGLKNVHMGKIKRTDGTWDWMYKGHVDFQDDDETVQITGNEYEDVKALESGSGAYCALKPVYYLIEVKNEAGESYTYDYLVPHVEGHNTDGKNNIQTDPKTGLILNDSDPLIGTYIAKGFKSDSQPTVYATAIYMFERPVNGNETGVFTNFNRLEVESLKVNGNETASESKSSAPARIRPGVSDSEFAATGAGELPNAGVAPEGDVLDMTSANPDPVTGYKAYAVVKGATYYDMTGGTVTGVEDVLADGENGEAVYYNMQGMRIAEPTTAGVYFRVVGKEVTKFVVK